VTSPDKYVLRLYITGLTPRSTRAIGAVREVCEKHLKGCYELEIIDVYQQPGRITSDQIVAIPTLIRCHPEPKRLLIGDMSDRARVLFALGLPADG
jgi:circadian clock protein KaiB